MLIGGPSAGAAEAASSAGAKVMSEWVYVDWFSRLSWCQDRGKAEVNQNGALGYSCQPFGDLWELWVQRP
ncbi:hypothetical protein DV20_06075 [Amycolatopsis rifamycinica]|uniref:Uncharacterized protein n=2 Tax=Amycolatopsis rifamycinica TaxID=287986 RepID=A0A066U751_9PSEU|nr:hypothetical protein DV20_06075 [Amycolatopsis rifamycinica]